MSETTVCWHCSQRLPEAAFALRVVSPEGNLHLTRGDDMTVCGKKITPGWRRLA